MSIGALREELKDTPGGLGVTMRYENNGAIQVYRIGDEELRFDGHLSISASDILTALELKKKD